MNKKQKKALYESIMKQVAKTVKKALNESVSTKITEDDIASLAAAFICDKPCDIDFNENDLQEYIKNQSGFKVYDMQDDDNYNNDDVINDVYDIASDLNYDLKQAIISKVEDFDEDLANIIDMYAEFDEVYAFVSDIINYRISSIEFDEDGDYTIDGGNSNITYESGCNDYLIDMLEGY